MTRKPVGAVKNKLRDTVRDTLRDSKPRGRDSKESSPRGFSLSARITTSPRSRVSSSPVRPSSLRPGVASPRLPVSVSTPVRISVITLLTDFGEADYFVGAMKGVILSLNPQAQIVDITHEVPPQDILAGAFTLLAAYRSFPEGTIHVAVVDPGVGSARRPILLQAGGHVFVGPDNGIFSYICDREIHHQIFQLTNSKWFGQPVSPTFHGRDVFAPVAAALSGGLEPSQLGNEVQDYVRLEPLAPDTLKNGSLKGRIIHIDRFGNCITNITPEHLPTKVCATLTINGTTISSFRRFFAEEPGDGKKGNGLFAVWGSAGFLEIAARDRSAAKLMKAKRGQTVTVAITTVAPKKQ